jgi:anti-sigma regulatory factor (Ser/Thr protein kinase)
MNVLNVHTHEGPMSERPDEVHLVVPASAEYAMVARLVASGLASRRGMSYDDVEDLRVVIAEVCRLLVGPAVSDDRGDGTIAFAFGIGADRLTLEATSSTGRPEFEPDEHDLAAGLLLALTDEYEADLDGDQPRVRIVKQYTH